MKFVKNDGGREAAMDNSELELWIEAVKIVHDGERGIPAGDGLLFFSYWWNDLYFEKYA